MDNTTGTVQRNVDGNGSFVESQSFPVCSVELGETAKGDIQVKSVKAYSQSIVEAGEQALAEFLRLKATIGTSDGS